LINLTNNTRQSYNSHTVNQLVTSYSEVSHFTNKQFTYSELT